MPQEECVIGTYKGPGLAWLEGSEQRMGRLVQMGDLAGLGKAHAFILQEEILALLQGSAMVWALMCLEARLHTRKGRRGGECGITEMFWGPPSI